MGTPAPSSTPLGTLRHREKKWRKKADLEAPGPFKEGVASFKNGKSAVYHGVRGIKCQRARPMSQGEAGVSVLSPSVPAPPRTPQTPPMPPPPPCVCMAQSEAIWVSVGLPEDSL